MKIGKFLKGIIEIALRLIVICAVLTFIYNASVTAYDFGFQIFAERPVSMGSGRIVKVTVPMESSASDIGKILKDNGLIKDSTLFVLQEFVSAYHGDLKPGEYELSTSMTPTEMMQVMAGQGEPLTDDEKDSKEK